MSHILPILACPNLQIDLNNFNACKSFPRENLPLISFLTDRVNTSGVLEANVTPGSGKLRTVEIVYQQRYGEATVSSTLTTDCDSNNEPGLLSTPYQIDPLVGVEINQTFSAADFATQCKGNSEFVAMTIQNMFDTLARATETRLTQQSVALAGKFVTNGDSNLGGAGNNSYKTIATKYADGKFSEDAVQEIGYSARNSGFCGMPFVFGYNEISKYMYKTKAVCCAASGIDFNAFMAQNQLMFMETFRVPDAFGVTTDFLVVDPGSLYLLRYNRFEEGNGILFSNTDNLKIGIITDPKTGLSYNYKAHLNPCGEKFNIFISSAFKVVSLPADMYAVNDRFYGTNGVLHFKITNP